MSASPSEMPHRYQIPTHLGVPDKIVVPLPGLTVSVTARQGLIYLFGWSTAFQLWQHLAFLEHSGTAGLIIHVFFPGLLALLTFVCATLRIAGRHAETWLLVLLRYGQQPKIYLWRSVILERSSASATEFLTGNGSAHQSEMGEREDMTDEEKEQ